MVPRTYSRSQLEASSIHCPGGSAAAQIVDHNLVGSCLPSLSSCLLAMEPLLAAAHNLLAQAPPPKELLLLTGTIGAAAATIQALWNLFFSPLARQKIPGPPLAAISEIWWSWHGLRFQRIHALHTAFKVHCSISPTFSVNIDDASLDLRSCRTHRTKPRCIPR